MELKKVSFKLAEKLKELNFDILCHWYYLPFENLKDLKEHDRIDGKANWNIKFVIDSTDLDKYSFPYYSSPELELVKRWFEKIHKIKVDAKHARSNGTFKYTIWKWNFDNNVGDWERIGNYKNFNDYDDALEQGLFDACQLINI